MIRKLLTCFYREPRENQNNSGNQQNVSCFNVRRVRSHKPDLLTTLPPELRLNIAERLPLPSLLSLRTVNSNMYHIIDSKMLSKAKERCIYDFHILQKPLDTENNEQQLLSEWQNVNVIYCDEENRGNSYNIQSIDGVDKLGSFTTGRFTDGSYFIYVSANFEDRSNRRIAITLSQENRNLYLGSSYSQISDYIKNNRTDDLVNHVEWISQHTKMYF
ncbi:F-box protein [Endozoicomonas atrinae]|uniref:F-box protein n=1 Tax=Endozoicomonas atrinae TaxID=1333660 RepID=UPI0009F6B38C|nr:F-box protein [Endozoicomonas atrinae]